MKEDGSPVMPTTGENKRPIVEITHSNLLLLDNNVALVKMIRRIAALLVKHHDIALQDTVVYAEILDDPKDEPAFLQVCEILKNSDYIRVRGGIKNLPYWFKSTPRTSELLKPGVAKRLVEKSDAVPITYRKDVARTEPHRHEPRKEKGKVFDEKPMTVLNGLQNAKVCREGDGNGS
jgi:hypothetical protein